MKYLLTVELTREELMDLHANLLLHTSPAAEKIKLEISTILGWECPNCGEPSGWVESGHLCPKCEDSQQELLALSRAAERDREATTG